jgi:sn-glycerol 3-phosphate transport system permease protein
VFWLIFVTLMLPVEVRIGPTYQVVSTSKMLNTYAGLSVPLIASATATFLFRQFFLTVPDELVEAARMDGAGPMRFFKDVLLPLSRPRSRRCSSSSSSTAGTSTCGRCW